MSRLAPFEPGHELPAIAARPQCPNCQVRLVPWTSGGYGAPRRWTGQYKRYGAFCTLRCCEAFANAAHRAGYRIVGG